MNIYDIPYAALLRIQQAYLVKQAADPHSNSVVVTLPDKASLSKILSYNLLYNTDRVNLFLADNGLKSIDKVPANAKLIVRDPKYVRRGVSYIPYAQYRQTQAQKARPARAQIQPQAALQQTAVKRSTPTKQTRLPNYNTAQHQYQDYVVQPGSSLPDQLRAMHGDFVDTPLFRLQYIYVNYADPFLHQAKAGDTIKLRQFRRKTYPKAQYVVPKDRISFHPHMLKALQFALTGTFLDPWIRTMSNAGGKGSSAFGPLQINQALMKPAVKNYAARLAPYMQYIDLDFMPMTRLMLLYGKLPDKLGYRPQFLYKRLVYPQSDWAKQQYMGMGGALLDIAALLVRKHKRNRGREWTNQDLADLIAYMWRLGNDAYDKLAERRKVLELGYINKVRKYMKDNNVWGDQ